MRRDDDVGVVPANRAGQWTRAEQREPGPRKRAGRRKACEEQVLEPVRPGRPAKLEPVCVSAEERHDPAEAALERVEDDDFAALGRQLDLEGAGDRRVSFAFFGGQDQNSVSLLVGQRADLLGGGQYPNRPGGRPQCLAYIA